MSLSSTTLSIIQKAGAAAFAADVNLKNAVKDYAERVNAAMLNNPDGLGNDVLFANWKIVSRLSQTVSGIEEELRKLFLVASDLGSDKQVVAKVVKAVAKPKAVVKPKAAAKKKVARAAKVAPAVLDAAAELAVAAPAQVAAKAPAKSKVKAAAKTKAVVKATKVKVAKVAKLPKVAKAKPKATRAPKAAGSAKLGANPTKVLRQLETLLNAQDFNVISQTAVSKETGIPLGSMTAAIKKLLETGHLVAGPSGSYKLATAPSAAE